MMLINETLNRTVCWIIGDKWKFHQTEREADGYFRHWFQCQRCGWYTNTGSFKVNKIRQPKPFHVFRRFRAWLENIGIRYRSQNLNEKAGGVKGSMWRHGRGWLYLGNIHFGLSWNFFGRSSTGVDLDLGGEDEFAFSIRLYRVFALWFHINHILPRKWTRRWKWWDWTWGREFGFSIHDGSIWISIFRDTIVSPNRYWWQEITIHLDRIILGRQTSTHETLDEGEVTIAFPEGSYPIKYKKILSAWKRPRWFKKQWVRYELDMDNNPIPVPGKGENSWDIDDDAIYMTSVSATNLPQALARLTESVYRTRIKYGGLNWLPAPPPTPAQENA